MLPHLFLWLFTLASVAFLIWRGWFFLRDPNRTPPAGNGFLSPADGYVVYLKRVEAGVVPVAVKQGRPFSLEELSACTALQGCSGYLIGIYMTAFSVHHNRTPLGGQVSEVIWKKAAANRTMAPMMTNLLTGRRPYEKNCDYLLENERVTTIVKTPSGFYALTQIADKWISHIINPCEPGQFLERGAKFGLIRFGSQVDVFLPDNLGYKPVSLVGAYVYAGESVIAQNDTLL